MKRCNIVLVITAGLCWLSLSGYRLEAAPLEVIQLSPPDTTGSTSFEQVLAARRSIREFAAKPLDLNQLGQLAWAGQGITDPNRGFRTAPSAGALYPIQLYFATQDGLFVYQPEQHSLEKILAADIRARLAEAALDQQQIAQAACDIILVGSVRKLAGKYGIKARRYMLLEAGHVAQNILLQAVSLELAAVPTGAFNISRIRRLCRLSPVLEPLYILCLGLPGEQTPGETARQQPRPSPTIGPPTALLIIASRDFQDQEYFETKRILDSGGIRTVTASTRKGNIRGMRGRQAHAEILLNEVNVRDYAAIVFIGGSGAREYFHNNTALDIARQAAQNQKILAAICIAPTILANANLLRGLEVTGFPSERTKLKKAGAQYTGSFVERTGLVITARGPEAAEAFGQAILKTLAEQNQNQQGQR